jgi:hypothetical protein
VKLGTVLDGRVGKQLRIPAEGAAFDGTGMQAPRVEIGSPASNEDGLLCLESGRIFPIRLEWQRER